MGEGGVERGSGGGVEGEREGGKAGMLLLVYVGMYGVRCLQVRKYICQSV